MNLDLDAARTRFREGRCHHVVIPEFIAEDRASRMRGQLDDAGFEVFYEPDRGRFAINRAFVMPELFEELRAIVELVVEHPVAIGPAHWLRLQHLDYALLKADAKPRVVDKKHVEVTLDFSSHPLGQAEVVYTDGMESWPILQQPRCAAIVERDDWLYRYDRYLDHRVAPSHVYRLRLALL